MKKLSALFLIFVLCFTGCVIEDASLFYSDTFNSGGFHIAVNKTANRCFVGTYNCTELSENPEITIPDDYNGVPIRQLGGYYGRGVADPFSVSLADLYVNVPSNTPSVFIGNINEFDITGEYTIENVVFNLNIGKNIENIELVVMDMYYPHIDENGSVILYHPVVNINCNSENKWFYSENGKLFYKETGELVSDFAYTISE